MSIFPRGLLLPMIPGVLPSIPVSVRSSISRSSSPVSRTTPSTLEICGRTFLPLLTGSSGATRSTLWTALPGSEGSEGVRRGERPHVIREARESCLAIFQGREIIGPDWAQTLRRNLSLRPPELARFAHWLTQTLLQPTLPHARDGLEAWMALWGQLRTVDRDSLAETLMNGLNSDFEEVQRRAIEMLRFGISQLSEEMRLRVTEVARHIAENGSEEEGVRRAARALAEGR